MSSICIPQQLCKKTGCLISFIIGLLTLPVKDTSASLSMPSSWMLSLSDLELPRDLFILRKYCPHLCRPASFFSRFSLARLFWNHTWRGLKKESCDYLKYFRYKYRIWILKKLIKTIILNVFLVNFSLIFLSNLVGFLSVNDFEQIGTILSSLWLLQKSKSPTSDVRCSLHDAHTMF